MSNGRPVRPEYKHFVDRTLEKFLERKPDTTENTLRSHRDRLVSVINRLEDMQIPVDPAKLRIQDGLHFIDELTIEGLNRNSVESYAYTLRMYAETNGNDSLWDIASYIESGPKFVSLSNKEVLKLLAADLIAEQEIVLHLMLFFGGSEKDLTKIKVSDIDFGDGTVTLRPLPDSDIPRVQKFVTMPDGKTSREVFERYLAFRDVLVRWVRYSNPSAAEPEELLIYDWGTVLRPFNEASTSITNRLREISKVTGIRLTEGLLLNTYSRNLSYSGMSAEEFSNFTERKVRFPAPQGAT